MGRLAVIAEAHPGNQVAKGSRVFGMFGCWRIWRQKRLCVKGLWPRDAQCIRVVGEFLMTPVFCAVVSAAADEDDGVHDRPQHLRGYSSQQQSHYTSSLISSAMASATAGRARSRTPPREVGRVERFCS